MKQRRVDREEENVRKNERVETAVKEKEEVTLVAQETAPLSYYSFHNPSVILFEALHSYCQTFDCLFQMTAKMFETDGVSLDGQEDLVLIDPLFNVHREPRRSGTDYHKLTTHDLAPIYILCTQLTKSEGHGHVFCSDAQFSLWVQVAKGFLEGSLVVQKENFVVKQKSLVQFRDNPSYLQYSSRANMYNINMTEHVMRFWHIGGH